MIVIIETHTEPVNPPSTSPIITHEQLWKGLLYFMHNKHLLIDSIKTTEVISETEEEIVFSHMMEEHSTTGHYAGEHRNKFTLSPPSKFDGTETGTTDFHAIGIIGHGPGGDTDLYYTLVYEWNEKGVQKGSAEHEEKKTGNFHPRDLAQATVEVTRKMVRDGVW